MSECFEAEGPQQRRRGRIGLCCLTQIRYAIYVFCLIRDGGVGWGTYKVPINNIIVYFVKGNARPMGCGGVDGYKGVSEFSAPIFPHERNAPLICCC